MKWLPLLEELSACVSTPGDEEEVRLLLEPYLSRLAPVQTSCWGDLWCTKVATGKEAPHVLVTAHMDSPGFILKRILPTGELDLVPLGGIAPSKVPLAPARLRNGEGQHREGVIEACSSERGANYRGFFGFSDWREAEEHWLCPGDRVSFWAPLRQMGEYLQGPHLDNRLGCLLLAALAEELSQHEELPVTLTLAATTGEEMGGRGALTLAHQLSPQVAICLDATYEEEPVVMGKGPVLTLSDAGVLLSLRQRERLLHLADQAEVPIQLEVYNYGATDARGFQHSPSGCVTFSLLMATRHNHTPWEIVHWRDVEQTLKLLVHWIRHYPFELLSW